MTDNLHLLTGAYAIDALDDIERAQFERHLAGCVACQEELVGLRAAAAMLPAISEARPPAALRERVLADISRTRPLPPRAGSSAASAQATTKPSRSPAGSRSWSRKPGLLVAAAAAVIALGVGAAVTQPWDSGTDGAPTAASTVMSASDAQRLTSEVGSDPKARMTVVRSASQHLAVMMTEGVPQPPAGRVYQAWFRAPNGHYISAGLMQEVNGAPVVLNGDAANAVAVALTMEPSGGSSQPSEAPRAIISFAKA